MEKDFSSPSAKNRSKAKAAKTAKKPKSKRRKYLDDYAEKQLKQLSTSAVNHKDKELQKEVKAIRRAVKPKTSKMGKEGNVAEVGSNLEDEKKKKTVERLQKKALEDKIIAWQPQEGPQVWFLEADEDEVLFSGGRGSGKSDCLIVDPLRYCDNKNFRALILRNTMDELRELISRAKSLYPEIYKGVRWKEQAKLFEFPSGASIEYGYADKEDDIERYRGQEYTWLGIDEITKFKTEAMLDRLKGSLRTTDPNLRIYIRATTNPTGAGKMWVKERFIDRGPSNTTIRIKPQGIDLSDFEGVTEEDLVTTRKWIQSTVKDNKILMENNPGYVAGLAYENEALREAWLHGSWEAAEGLAFTEFKTSTHVIDPFAIPHEWTKFRAADWGYSTMAACLWFARDFDNNLYIYRELCTTKVTAAEFAHMVMDLEQNEYIRAGILDSSTWANRGETGLSIAEEMISQGCMWTPSDRSPGSRISGKLMVHKYLQGDGEDTPKVRIFNTCRNLIKELGSLEIDKNKEEDVDTDMQDHAYDAFRYGITSRNTMGGSIKMIGQRQASRPTIVDPSFGY